MSKHTPGPWAVENGSFVKAGFDDATPWGVAIVTAVDETRDYVVLTINGRPISSGERNANACLIAAAPELLEALYLALPYVEVQEGDEHYKKGAVAKALKTMRAAISKAEGR